MGYYADSDFVLNLGADPDHVVTALGGVDTLTWKMEEFGEEAGITFDGSLLHGWTVGKWYGGTQYATLMAEMSKLGVTGIVDFSDQEGAHWRDRLHGDGRVTTHTGRIVYDGDGDQG